jgi:hypothetical protein
MELTYDNFKKMLETDQQLIKDYFKFKPGDLLLSPYGEVILIKSEDFARKYRRDPTLMPMLTSDLLIDSIEALLHGVLVEVEVKEHYIYVSINQKESLGLKLLKGYSLNGKLFDGLLNIFLKVLNDKESRKVG